MLCQREQARCCFVSGPEVENWEVGDWVEMEVTMSRMRWMLWPMQRAEAPQFRPARADGGRRRRSRRGRRGEGRMVLLEGGLKERIRG